jgi:hypothetical protein
MADPDSATLDRLAADAASGRMHVLTKAHRIAAHAHSRGADVS